MLLNEFEKRYLVKKPATCLDMFIFVGLVTSIENIKKAYISQKYITKKERIRMEYHDASPDPTFVRTVKTPIDGGGVTELCTIATEEEFNAIPGKPIMKTRYYKYIDEHKCIICIDVFHNIDLMIIECETDDKEVYDNMDILEIMPIFKDYIEREVTNEHEFKNARMYFELNK